MSSTSLKNKITTIQVKIFKYIRQKYGKRVGSIKQDENKRKHEFNK